MRLLVLCCIVTCSAQSTTITTTTAAPAAVYSEHQFKTEYEAAVSGKDAAAVKTINANIVGTVTPGSDKELHRWYHHVSEAVQANAQAIMDKGQATEAPTHPTAECLTLIDAAAKTPVADDWTKMYTVYSQVLGDTDTGLSAENKKARACINTLSGAEKELAIQAGLRAKLFDFWKKKADVAWEVGEAKDMLKVSAFVTGTLAANPPAAGQAGEEGKDTQPMYTQADAVLRGELMNDMVQRLNAQLPAPL